MNLQNLLEFGDPVVRRSRRWGRLGFLIMASYLSGCASAKADDPFNTDANNDGISVMVYSRHDYHVDIYVNSNGRRQLLGTVRSNQQEFFQFRYPAGRPLMMEIESELGEHFRVPATVLTGGGQVDLRIAPTLRDSQYIRRGPSEP